MRGSRKQRHVMLDNFLETMSCRDYPRSGVGLRGVLLMQEASPDARDGSRKMPHWVSRQAHVET